MDYRLLIDCYLGRKPSDKDRSEFVINFEFQRFTEQLIWTKCLRIPHSF